MWNLEKNFPIGKNTPTKISLSKTPIWEYSSMKESITPKVSSIGFGIIGEVGMDGWLNIKEM